MAESTDRREAALAAWAKFTNEQGIKNAPAPELQPVTATIRSLPASMSTPLHLPKVGEGSPSAKPEVREEETRESLKRFITSARAVIGAEPQQLSLVKRTDLADGTRVARYEQRPFIYPLYGDYGVLEITFAPDRRVLQMTSTCIPEIDQLRRSGAGTRPRVAAEKVPALVAGRTYTYEDASGVKQTVTFPGAEGLTVRQLLVFPRPRPTDPSVLEFHLAWEILLDSGPGSTAVYLDAVSDEVLAARRVSG